MATYNYEYREQTEEVSISEEKPRGTEIIGIDYETGLGILENSGLKRIKGAESLLQRIIKFLRTEKNFYELYSESLQLHESNNRLTTGGTYGFSIYEAIGYTFSSVVLSKYTKEIREYLLKEFDVVSIETIKLIPVEDKILIDIQMTSIHERIDIKEVIGSNSLYKGF